MSIFFTFDEIEAAAYGCKIVEDEFGDKCLVPADEKEKNEKKDINFDDIPLIGKQYYDDF